jgi:DNA-3-methyladenine glycosylase II
MAAVPAVTRAAFSIVPQGPFSLERAREVVLRFPPLRHQPKTGPRRLRLGFILDQTHESVVVELEERAKSGELRGTFAGTTRKDLVVAQIARILSLDHDATAYPDLAYRDPKLRTVLHAFPGLRPVCFTSPYECACWAILSQRITTTQAARIVSELVRAHGEVVRLGEEAVSVFPRPDRLLDVSSIPGVPTPKLDRLHGIANAALAGDLDAEMLRTLGDLEGPLFLRSLPGIGPFWSMGIYLRACGIADVFPDEPLSLAALGELHGLGSEPPRSAVERIVARYRPFRMWIAFLLRVAAARGVVASPPQLQV